VTLTPALSAEELVNALPSGTGSILVIRLMQSDEKGWGNRFGSGETVSRRYADELESPKLSQNPCLTQQGTVEDRAFRGG